MDMRRRLLAGAKALAKYAATGKGLSPFFGAIRPDVGSTALLERHIVDDQRRFAEPVHYVTTTRTVDAKSVYTVVRGDALTQTPTHVAWLVDSASPGKALWISQAVLASGSQNLALIVWHKDVDRLPGFAAEREALEAVRRAAIKAGVQRFLAMAAEAIASDAIEAVLDAAGQLEVKAVLES